MRRGLFITFEGCEGSGKSTQSRLLHSYLRRKGWAVVYIREPGSTVIGEQIRKILLSPKNKMMSSVCETLLYMASRIELVRMVIKPALQQKKIVICDRFLDSTRVYQGYGLNVNREMIEFVGQFATDNLTPDLTIFLDVAAREGLKRLGGKKDRIEKRSIIYHQRVRKGYLDLAKQFPRRIKIIKVEEDRYTTQIEIRKLVERFLIR